MGYARELSWSVVSVCLVALTLWALLFYARDTWEIANLQREELGLRKTPVISIRARRPVKAENAQLGEFWTEVINHSNVHAKAQFEVCISSVGLSGILPIAELHPYGEKYAYGGGPTWSLQAGLRFRGALGLRDALGDLPDFAMRERLKGSFIQIDSWVARFDGEGAIVREKAHRNPTLYFVWNETSETWDPHPQGPPLPNIDNSPIHAG